MKIKEVVQVELDKYLSNAGLTKGTIPVALDRIMEDFQAKNPELPVTKPLLGRMLSKNFLKKQLHTDNGFCQCYYLNKNI